MTETAVRKAWLDVSILQCPNCGRYYADASWYVVELESDIECGECHTTFNTKNALKDRVMLEFTLTSGLVTDVRVSGHIDVKR